MKLIKYSIGLCFLLLFYSCGIYTKYKQNTEKLQTEVFRLSQDVLLTENEESFGNVSWKELFTDTLLNQLIAKGIAQNIDLQTALLSVKQVEAQLLAAKLSFLPSLAIAPSASFSSIERLEAVKSYALPIQASWNIDLFGGLLNEKRNVQTTLLQAKDYQLAVQCRLISNIANTYYTLSMIDEQEELMNSMKLLAKETWHIIEMQKQYGLATENAVQTAKASYYAIEATLTDLQKQKKVTENALALLLGEGPQPYRRSSLYKQQWPQKFTISIPIQLLKNRPDVHAAEMKLAACFYQSNRARAAFYPILNIGGSATWTNQLGGVIVNPAKLLATAVASLTQPIFAKGKLVAGLKVAKLEEEKAYLAWQQSILNAGMEVSNALTAYHAAVEKGKAITEQINSLKKSYEISKTLFETGKTTSYLEVITAQTAWLQAETAMIRENFNKTQAVISLYTALGGGRY